MLGFSIWKQRKVCSQKNILKLIMHLYEVFKCYPVSQVLNECLHFISVFTEHKLQQNGIFQAVRFDSDTEKHNAKTRKQSLHCHSLFSPLVSQCKREKKKKKKKLLYYMQTTNTAAAEFTHMVIAIWPSWTVALKTLQPKQVWSEDSKCYKTSSFAPVSFEHPQRLSSHRLLRCPCQCFIAFVRKEFFLTFNQIFSSAVTCAVASPPSLCHSETSSDLPLAHPHQVRAASKKIPYYEAQHILISFVPGPRTGHSAPAMASKLPSRGMMFSQTHTLAGAAQSRGTWGNLTCPKSSLWTPAGAPDL